MNFPQKGSAIPVIAFPLLLLQNPCKNQLRGSLTSKHCQENQSQTLNKTHNVEQEITQRQLSHLSLKQDNSKAKQCNQSKQMLINMEKGSYFPRSQSIVSKNDIFSIPSIKNLNQVRNQQKLKKLINKEVHAQSNASIINSPEARISQSFIDNPIQYRQLQEQKATQIVSLQQIEEKHEDADFLNKYNNKIDELFMLEDKKDLDQTKQQNKKTQQGPCPKTTSCKSFQSNKCTFSERLKHQVGCKPQSKGIN